VRRLLLAALAVGALAWILLAFVVTTATERVEEETERLLELARTGGPEAAAAILDAFAPDYRGGSYSREQVERAVWREVGERRVRKLWAPSLTSEWTEDEIAVTGLLVVELGDGGARLALQLLFAERDGAWKIVDVRNPLR